KLLLVMTGAFLALLILNVDAQPLRGPQALEIAYNKTTSLVFPAIIKSVDRGSRDLLAQKAKGVENILQLKAARHGFPNTNLTVITSDGKIHEFTVAYSKAPGSLVINIGNSESHEPMDPEPIFETEMTETEMEKCASQIVNAKRSIRFVKESRHKMGLLLHGIYIKDNVIFYHFRIRNQSNITYDVDFLRLYIEDRQKVKRTASQQVDVKPVYVYGNSETIKGKSTEDVIYALGKFTIPDAKRLVIEMFEKNGGRNLSLAIRNKTIVNALLVD
ncbi:MAG: conjugative transposon protein TraN, partial [Cyclobacteriaceae bacterium]